MYRLVFRRVPLIVFLMISLNTIINAQWSMNLSTDQEYNDNPFLNRTATKTFLSTVDFGIVKNLDYMTINYSGLYVNFNSAPDRNFYLHQITLNKDFENSSIGINAEQRMNKDIYTYYDYTNLSAFYNDQFIFGDFFLALSPSLSLTTYKNISIMDNIKASLSWNLNHGFETGTTLIFGGAFNYKKYLYPTQTGTYSYVNESNNLVTEYYKDKNISSLTQLVTLGRIAQSVTPTTGLAFQYINRSILSGVASYVKELNIVYGDESEMFDDPVNYNGSHYSIELTQILLEDLEIKAGYQINRKNYPSQGLYDSLYNYDTSGNRSDIQNILNISVKRSFQFDFLNGSELSLKLNYQIINNQSNSYPFDYKSNSLSLNMGFGF
jgi:hypothetical protein